MLHLVGRIATITLEKPLRAHVPGVDVIGRVLAFDGRLAGVTEGVATFDVEALLFHPDDAPSEENVGLAAYVYHGPIHVPVGLVQGIVEHRVPTDGDPLMASLDQAEEIDPHMAPAPPAALPPPGSPKWLDNDPVPTSRRRR